MSLTCKALLALGLVWLASPIDLVPELIPVVGPLDDALVAALILRYVIRRTGREIAGEHWPGDSATLDRLLSFAGLRPS